MPLFGKSPRIRVSVDKAADGVEGAAEEVSETADFYEALGKKFEKFGARVKVVKYFPRLVFDIKIKDE